MKKPIAACRAALKGIPRDRQFRLESLKYALILAVSTASTVYAPFVFGIGIQYLASGKDTTIAIVLIAAYGLLISLARVFYELKLVAVKRIEQLFLLNASRTALDAIDRQTNDFFLDNNGAKLLQIIGRYKSSITMRVQVIMHSVVPSLAEYLFSFLLVAFYVDLVIGAVVFAYGLGAIYIARLSTHKLTPLLDKSQQQSIKSSSTFGDLISNLNILRYYGASRKFGNSIIDDTIAEHRYWDTYFRKRVLFTSANSLLFFAQYAVVTALVLNRYFEGQLDIAQLVTVNLIILQLSRPFELIGNSMKELANARVMQSNMKHIRDTAPAPVQRDSLGRGDGSVVLDGLGFAYPGRVIFEGLNHRFVSGAMNFIVGPSGAGKSTLLKIVSGQCEGFSGTVFVNGADIGKVSARSMHVLVGYVPQDPFISNVSVFNNIACGRPASQNDVEAAARKARIHDRIMQLDAGYRTRVGEAGAKLSGGECQRIAVARALLGSPQILLLDEASASLDSATERLIFETLREHCPDLTIIAVTHRVNIIRPDDFVLDLTASASLAGAAGKPVTA